jgi:cytidylate kinase
MAVVTISRQLGSLGRDVALLVAERLGYRFVWRDMINEAARRSSTPEVALATIDELDLFGLTPAPSARKAYCNAVQQVMEELAQEGNVVILGRAGQIVLQGHPHLFSARVIAPLALRAERTSKQQGITIEAAQFQVEASDKHRREYLLRFYQADWDDPAMHDLVINTAHIAPPEAAGLICQLVLHNSAKQTQDTKGATS